MKTASWGPSRRQLLQSLAVGCIGPASAESAAIRSRQRLLTIVFSGPNHARVVGLACFRAGAAPRPWAMLEASLAGLPGRLALMQDAQVASAVDARLRADFAAGELRIVDGWVLSRTEVDLYLLAAGLS